MLDIVLVQYQEKTKDANLRKWQKNLISGPIMAHLTQIFSPQNFFVGFISTRYQTLSQTIIVFNFKENLWSKLTKIAKNIFLDLI